MHLIETKHGLAKIWTDPNRIEHSAMQQIYNTLKHPRLTPHLAIMPDVHYGMGATIGSVLPLKKAIIPAAVGVDIGCGMGAIKTNVKLGEGQTVFDKFHQQLVHNIPVGMKHDTLSENREWFLSDFLSGQRGQIFLDQIEFYQEIYPKPILPQLGTLGGGNHFIELQTDDDNNIWIMIHSGSRNVGFWLANEYIRKAKKQSQDVADPALKYFDVESPVGREYIEAMNFSVEFAYFNRMMMTEIVKREIRELLPAINFAETINIPHNYAVEEEHFGQMVWVHRKGATKVTSEITGIIPGSMGSKSYIVKGKDNADSFHSCSHGAGRTMSRGQAKKTLSMDKFRQAMSGVFSGDVNQSHLDEAPEAYKDISEVMANQSDLVEILVELTPVFNRKG